MSMIVWSIVLSVCAVLPIVLLTRGWRNSLTPDGQMYFALARGERVPAPYNRRLLLPLVIGPRRNLWLISTYCSLLAIAPLICGITSSIYGRTLTLFEVLWIVGLSYGVGWTWLISRMPLLQDAQAMMLWLGASLLMLNDHWFLGMLLLATSTLARESSPLFCALIVGSPVPLLCGSVTLLVRKAYLARRIPRAFSWLTLTTREVISLHRQHYSSSLAGAILPWGLLVLAILPMYHSLLLYLTVILTVVLSYSSLLMGLDRVRLFQSGFPILIVGCLGVVEPISSTWVGLVLLSIHYIQHFVRGCDL
jgi:hypothetical protein